MSEKSRRAEASYQRWLRREEFPEPRTAMLTIRISEHDRAEIAQLASEAKISQADLILRRVLGRARDPLEIRLRRLAARVERLEIRSYGVALSDDEFDSMMIDNEEGM